MTEAVTEDNGDKDESHAKYLLMATNYLNGISSNALRCHWNILLADIMQMKKLTLSKREKSEAVNCQYCLTPWRNGLFSVRVVPKAKRGRKLRKLLKLVKAEKQLSKVQKNLAQVIHSGPTVVLNCKICHKSSKFKLPPIRKVEVATKEVHQMEPHQSVVENEKVGKYKKKKLKKKRKKDFSGLNLVIMDPINDFREKDSVKNENINRKSADDDNDVVIINENVKCCKINDAKSRKRNLDNNVMDILEPSLGKLMKIDVQDSILANPLPITPLGSKSEVYEQIVKGNDDFIPLDGSNSKQKRNEKPKMHHRNEERAKRIGKLISHNQNNQFNQNKKNLTRWKRLIADEESKPIKTCTLQDFLSTL